MQCKVSNIGSQYKIHSTSKSTSIAEFKWKLIALIRPVKNTIYGVSDLKGIRNITKLCVQFSDLNDTNFITILSVLGLYVIVVWLTRTTSIMCCIAPALVNCEKISLALSLKCRVLTSLTRIRNIVKLASLWQF